ncbi:MAG: UbiD family decarboxylase [Acidimicrobiales bacterium]|jgi:4-hydroxy-3-polyprenylbenzoate decarboxylase
MVRPTTGADQDLRTFLDTYRRQHPEDVLVVDEALSAEHDVTALVWQLAARGHHEMLVLNNVAGFDTPVVTNMFASRGRVARMLGTDVAGLHATYQERARNLLEPIDIGKGPVLDEVRADGEVDLSQIHLLTHFESDAGPYITSGVIYAAHPETGIGNLSYHRAQVRSANELATSLHSRGHLWAMLAPARARNELLPAAMIIGAHPLFMLASSARVAPDVDERHIAGGLFGAPLEVVRTPRHGLGVPASAEIVLEGVIDPTRSLDEGPFGEFSGYSSHRTTNTCFRVETILRRRDSMLVDVVGGNSAEHLNLARIPRESEMAEKLKERFPNVVALHYPNSGTHFHCYVSLRPGRPGEARQVLLGLLGWDPYVKTAVAVDEDIDITDDEQVLWALATHFQPDKDLFVLGGLPGSPLDPSSSLEGTTSRLGLDATRPPGFAGTKIRISPEAMERAAAWCEGRFSLKAGER